MQCPCIPLWCKTNLDGHQTFGANILKRLPGQCCTIHAWNKTTPYCVWSSNCALEDSSILQCVSHFELTGSKINETADLRAVICALSKATIWAATILSFSSWRFLWPPGVWGCEGVSMRGWVCDVMMWGDEGVAWEYAMVWGWMCVYMWCRESLPEATSVNMHSYSVYT